MPVSPNPKPSQREGFPGVSAESSGTTTASEGEEDTDVHM